MQICNRWVQEDHIELPAGSQPLPSLTPRGQTCSQLDLAGSFSHMIGFRSESRLVCSTEIATTCGATRDVYKATIIVSSIDTAAYRRTATVVFPTTKLDTGETPLSSFQTNLGSACSIMMMDISVSVSTEENTRGPLTFDSVIWVLYIVR
ncbi:hypothetical protein TNCV_4679111 [Trichonephila clavipes]|nr:hypothetical protein TNCV_4679111 [Trichonephila clavipes]